MGIHLLFVIPNRNRGPEVDNFAWEGRSVDFVVIYLHNSVIFGGWFARSTGTEADGKGVYDVSEDEVGQGLP